MADPATAAGAFAGSRAPWRSLGPAGSRSIRLGGSGERGRRRGRVCWDSRPRAPRHLVRGPVRAGAAAAPISWRVAARCRLFAAVFV